MEQKDPFIIAKFLSSLKAKHDNVRIVWYIESRMKQIIE